MTNAKVIQPLHIQNDKEHPTIPVLSPNASVGQRWKFRRNAVIFVAHRNGFSQRFLADVFDLPRSRIAAIVKEFKAFETQRPGQVKILDE